MEKKRTLRYGIAEWYGHPIDSLGSAERKQLAALASGDAVKGSDKIKANLPCRFASKIRKNAMCNKPGGVCSIRPYWMDAESSVVAFDDRPVTICPRRFLEEDSLFQWVAETMLGRPDVTVIGEVSLLRNAGANNTNTDAKSGRIDWLLIDTDTSEPSMAALEMQSLYFSGHRMTDDFRRYETSDSLIYPETSRRPDYRSGGPKRLAPQLSVKVPLLRNWGIKTAVLVDRYFFGEMSTFNETVGDTLEDRLAASDIVWFIADYSEGKLIPGEIKFASLDASIKALSATEVMSKAKFQENIQRTLSRAAYRLMVDPIDLIGVD